MINFQADTLKKAARTSEVEPNTTASIQNILYATGKVRLRIAEDFLATERVMNKGEQHAQRQMRIAKLLGDLRSVFARNIAALEFERAPVPKNGHGYLEGHLDAKRIGKPYSLAKSVAECAQAWNVLERLMKQFLDNQQEHDRHIQDMRTVLNFAEFKKGAELDSFDHWDYAVGHCSERILISLLEHLFAIAKGGNALTFVRPDSAEVAALFGRQNIKLHSTTSHNVIVEGPWSDYGYELDAIIARRGQSGAIEDLMLFDATTNESNMREKVARNAPKESHFHQLQKMLEPSGCKVSAITAVMTYDRIGVIDHGKQVRGIQEPIVPDMFTAFVPCGNTLDMLARQTAAEMRLPVDEQRQYQHRWQGW
jgi:hypothetical protein